MVRFTNFVDQCFNAKQSIKKSVQRRNTVLMTAVKQKFGGKNSKLLMSAMKPKLDAIEKVRVDLNAENMEVPGIVVAGAQSAGKSSLLESLSDIKLPSGQNITTRVPLILRLEKQLNVERFAVISDCPDIEKSGEKITNLDNIPDKIEEYTKRIAGDDGCVKDSPIHLKVCGPECPTITLIDLPGITHMSLNNVQEDIHSETVKLVKKYISNEQMIILCVIPAVDDFANSEAIKLSKSVDPEGKRTLGVVTKVDLAKDDAKIADKLLGLGNNVKLSLGFIAVMNKMGTQTVKQARSYEDDYFSNSPYFQNISRQYWGTETLIDKITELQMIRVEEFIPKMINTLQGKINGLKTTLNTLAPQFSNDVQKMQHLVRIIVAVVSEFKSLAKSNDETNDNVDMHVGPRVFEMYREYCKTLIDKQPDFFSDEFSKKIQHALDESRSVMLMNFINHNAFNQLFIDSHIDFYKSNSRDLIEKIYEYCKKVLLEIVQKKMDTRYPLLLDATNNVITNYLLAQKEKAVQAIETLVLTECFIFTQNKMYQKLVTEEKNSAITQQTSTPYIQQTPSSEMQHNSSIDMQQTQTPGIQTMQQTPLSEMQQNSSIDMQQTHTPSSTVHAQNNNTYSSSNIGDFSGIHFLQKSLLAYSDISVSRIKDYVCMLCQYYLVTSVYKELHEHIEFEKMSTYLEDADIVVQNRREAEQSLKRFENSLKTLNKLVTN